MHTRANTDTHTRTPARAHTDTHVQARARARTHACTRPSSQTRMHACTHARTHTHARARAHVILHDESRLCAGRIYITPNPQDTLFLPGGAAVTWRVHVCTRASAHTHMDMHSKQTGRHCTRARVLALSVRTRLPPRLLSSLQPKACRRSHRQK